jgi:Secretion system C-terminal sorting domain/Dienelactone hydrolase family
MPTTEGGLSPNHTNFANDLKYLVTKMATENSLTSSPYYQRLSGKNAIMGHSMGGGCAFLAAASNTTVHAIITYAAATTNPSSITAAATVTCPSLTFGGSRDCVAAPATNAKAMYLGLSNASPRTYIEVKNGSHCQFGKASAFSRCNVAEGTACGSTASGFVSIASQHQQMLDASLPWLNYYLKNTCTGWTQFNNYLTTSTLHTYLRAGAVGVGCRMATIIIGKVNVIGLGSNNTISWEAMDETNLAFYSVQRSDDGENFTNTGSITSLGQANYSLNDRTATPHTYYRIVGEMQDGTRYFSHIVQVENTPLTTLNAFPNPFSTELTVAFDATEAGEATVYLQDLTGKMLNSQTITAVKGTNIVQIELNNANIGVYIVKAIVGSTIIATKVIKR